MQLNLIDGWLLSIIFSRFPIKIMKKVKSPLHRYTISPIRKILSVLIQQSSTSLRNLYNPSHRPTNTMSALAITRTSSGRSCLLARIGKK